MAFDGFDEILDLWPKWRKGGEDIVIKTIYNQFVQDEESHKKLKEAVEIILEDTPASKLPDLGKFIKRTFGQKVVPEAVIKTPSVGVSLYQKNVVPADTEDVFNIIWECWPRVPTFVERRGSALEAFYAACRVLPLEDLKTSCLAYAEWFGDSSSGMSYPYSLKNFLNNKEMVEEWLDKGKGNWSEECKLGRQHFECAYAWYPEFSSKNNKKNIESSWVQYWRFIKNDEKLDFLAICKEYRFKKRAECREQEMVDEECIQFTKSFVNFIAEWKDAFTGSALRRAKADLVIADIIKICKENDLDLVNIWGVTDEPFFSSVFSYWAGQVPTIKQAIYEAMLKTSAINNFDNVRDRKLAKEQISKLDAQKMSKLVYEKLFDNKLLEMPKNVIS